MGTGSIASGSSLATVLSGLMGKDLETKNVYKSFGLSEGGWVGGG
jgi:hypothetical protein